MYMTEQLKENEIFNKMEAIEEIRTIAAVEEEAQWAMGQSIGTPEWIREAY